jgi:hypothetical protein
LNPFRNAQRKQVCGGFMWHKGYLLKIRDIHLIAPKGYKFCLSR